MSGFLLDTNVLSEFSRRDGPDTAVKAWLTAADDSSLHASVLTLAEIRRGIELLSAGKRRFYLEQWFTHELRPSFADRVLPVTEAIANRWATLSAGLQNRGIRLATVDGLIAATALEHNLIMATRNIKDFVPTGVKIVSPWETSRT